MSIAIAFGGAVLPSLGQSLPPPNQADLDDAIRTGKNYGSTIPTPGSLIPKKSSGKRTIEANKITGVTEKNASAQGSVLMTQDDTRVRTERLDYDELTDTARSVGPVTMLRKNDVIEGSDLVYKINESVGTLLAPQFFFGRNPTRPTQRYEAWADASRMQFEGENLERFFGARYTTCKPNAVDWRLRVNELALDRNTNVGTGYNALVQFKGLPILYLPYMTFPLNNERRSGWLPPTIGSSSRSGLQLSVPYYWNIAANKDATITPTIFTKRGTQLAGEYRYMNRHYLGQIDTEWLPNDRKADRDRYLYSLRHYQNLSTTFDRVLGPGWSATASALKVSDDAYFRDLSTRVANTSQTNLPRDFAINYATDFGSWSARSLSFQTLQDPDPRLAIGKPYHLAPQITFNARPRRVNGLEFNTFGEYTDFTHPTEVNGRRTILYPSIARPFIAPYGFITPKLGFHFTRYTVTDHKKNFDGGTRSLPIFSLDSGLAFERPFEFRSIGYTQTLEPRLFFLYVPYRDQSKLPQFSTSETDFSFAQIFNENVFVGGDRIADARQLTAATTTRFIENTTGIERLRLAIGQRYYFHPQQVQLNSSTATLGTTGSSSRSDLLTALTGQLTRNWFLDSSLQYSTAKGNAQRSNVSARYVGDDAKLFNLSYRYTKTTLKQLDMSTQLPMTKTLPGLTLLARTNYSFQDRRLLEGLVGVEYNQGCWEIRLVAHRFATATNQYSNSIQFQLELKGLSKLGVNPFETLRQNISGYKRSEDRISADSSGDTARP